MVKLDQTKSYWVKLCQNGSRVVGLLVRERASLPASVKESGRGEIGGSSGIMVIPWEASSLIGSSWDVYGVEQREDSSESVMEDMRGLEDSVIAPSRMR